MLKHPFRRSVAWATLFAALFVVTLVMLVLRGALDKVDVALLYLIVVLVGSAAGGQLLGVTLATVAFFAFNFFFLPPYGTLALANPLDWFVLATFLITSFIATQLLRQGQREASEARARAAEVERLAALGSEALSAVRAEDALQAIAEIIQTTLRIDQCDVYIGSPIHGEPRLAARAGTPIAIVDQPPQTHEPVPEQDLPGGYVLAVPLRVRDRTVGALHLINAAEIRLVPKRQEFLDTFTYYAALGVERARLTSEAEVAGTPPER